VARILDRTFGGHLSKLQQDECTLGARILRHGHALQERQALLQELLSTRDVALESPEVALPGAQYY
jgi:hypothetical protein